MPDCKNSLSLEGGPRRQRVGVRVGRTRVMFQYARYRPLSLDGGPRRLRVEQTRTML